MTFAKNALNSFQQLLKALKTQNRPDVKRNREK